MDELILHLSDVLGGYGLFILLEFSRLSPQSNSFNTIVIVGIALGIAGTVIKTICQMNPPPWVRLCNLTVSVVLTLSVCLNLLSQLCPPSGKELCLIPCYAILCMPRSAPSSLAVRVLCLYGIMVIAAFLILPTSRHARPSGTSALGWDTIASLCFHVAFSSSFHSNLLPINTKEVWYGLLAVLCKGVLFLVLGSTNNTSLYNFFYEGEGVAYQITSAYGILLLFHCMLTAASWFTHLRETLGVRVDARIMSRIQHILYAVLVAAAWAFPLQLTGLRIILAVSLMVINTVY